MATLEQARQAKDEARRVFGRFGDVIGVGIIKAECGFGLKVNLRTAVAAGTRLPETIQDVPATVEVIGAIRGLYSDRA